MSLDGNRSPVTRQLNDFFAVAVLRGRVRCAKYAKFAAVDKRRDQRLAISLDADQRLDPFGDLHVFNHASGAQEKTISASAAGRAVIVWSPTNWPSEVSPMRQTDRYGSEFHYESTTSIARCDANMDALAARVKHSERIGYRAAL